MKVSHTVAYAIFATLQLARESAGVPISCSHLAHVGQLPKRFLLQILRRLVTHGVLRSTRGADGGYFLARPAEHVSLRDVVEAFDKPADFELPVLPGFSTTARNRMMAAMSEMREVARNELAKISIADLIRPASVGGGADE